MSSFSFRSRAAVIAAAASLVCGAVMAQQSGSGIDQDDPSPGSYPWAWTQVYNEAEGVTVWAWGHRHDTNGIHDGWTDVQAPNGTEDWAWVPANEGSTDPEAVDRENDD